MRASHPLRSLAASLVFAAVVLAPQLVAAQTPSPGVTPDASRPWTYYMSFPIILGSVAIAVLVGFSYLRLSPRFYAREEPQFPKPPPQYAGVNAPAYPAPVIEQPPQPAPAQASPQQAAPAGQPSPPGAPTPLAQPESREGAGPAAPPPRPEAPPATQEEEAPAPEEMPTAEAPTSQESVPAEPAAATTEPAPATTSTPATSTAAPANPDTPKGGDPETYERVLQEQLAKGVDRRIAEGRAKSAAIKAARPQGEGS